MAIVAVAAFVAIDVIAIITGNGHRMGPVIMALVLFPAYFAPTLIVASRNIPQAAPVAIIDLFLGWTCIGWIVALAISLVGTGPSAPLVPAWAEAEAATKKCPDCAETVLADARVCQHCGYRFAPAPETPAATTKAPHRHSLRSVRNFVRSSKNP